MSIFLLLPPARKFFALTALDKAESIRYNRLIQKPNALTGKKQKTHARTENCRLVQGRAVAFVYWPSSCMAQIFGK